MSLGPADVRAVEFALARRGYDEQQVDDFLDQVVAALEERDAALSAVRLEEDSQAAVDLLAMARRTAQEHVAAAEAAAAEVLAVAREEAAATTAAAEEQAGRVRAEAEAHHRDALAALHMERRGLEEQVAELRHLLERSRGELESYLTGVLGAVRAADAVSGPHPLPAISA